MGSGMQRFKNILAVVEITQSSSLALARAIKLAQNNQSNLTVVCVVPRMAAGIAHLQSYAVANANKALDEAVHPFGSYIDIKTLVLVGTPFLEIIKEVLRNDHDLVVKSPENLTWLHRMFGSDDMHLLRKCPCPVWLVKPSTSNTYRRILTAIDVDSDHPPEEVAKRHTLNVQLLEMAVSLALSDFAELHIVHAWQAIGENLKENPFIDVSEAEVNEYIEEIWTLHDQELEKLINEVIVRKNTEAGKFLAPTKHLIKGLPQKEIPELVDELGVDLVVMGTVARTGIPGFFIGNTAETILSQIKCSVLAVKPSDFVTPVTLN
jgi:nucleotide-binding universal stress UspA family protein